MFLDWQKQWSENENKERNQKYTHIPLATKFCIMASINPLERTQPTQQMVLAEFQEEEPRSTSFVLHKNKTKINQKPSLKM